MGRAEVSERDRCIIDLLRFGACLVDLSKLFRETSSAIAVIYLVILDSYSIQNRLAHAATRDSTSELSAFSSMSE
jgi:hypothetical protein